jgi:hypothetical protein
MAEYSADRFYVDATDGRGNREKVQITIPPSLYHELGNMMAARTVPDYRTMADFFRDAAIHRLHYLKENDFELTPAQLNMLAILRSSSELQAEKKVLDVLNENVENYRTLLAGSNQLEKRVLRDRIQRDLDTLTMPSRLRSALEELL